LLILLIFFGISSHIIKVEGTENGTSLNECFVEAPKIHSYPSVYTLGLIVDRNNLDELREMVRINYPVLYRIIKCESSWNESVCSYKGCGSGMGLGQIIPETLKYCEDKLNKKLDVFDAYDNLECSIYLYEKFGTAPWGSEKDLSWGSYSCWSK